MRIRNLLVGWLLLVGCARADQADEIARIHAEVIGGKERIEALTALRAAGFVVTGGKKIRFSMIAARPNRLRLETGAEGRSLVQVTDGIAAPWKIDTGVWPPRHEAMADAEAKLFASDAEFDDPLVAGAARGFACDYAGEVDSGGRKMSRILVTRKMTDTFSLLVDTETYFIVARFDHRETVGGRRTEIVTRYEDYRPVDGVMLPHKVTVAIDGKPIQTTVIETIEANPLLTPETFVRPAATGTKK